MLQDSLTELANLRTGTNCEVLNILCEGYSTKVVWKSGKEKAAECNMGVSLPPILNGLETCEDRIFWKQYNEHLTTVLTVQVEGESAFREIMVPIAMNHQGLMHSILSLAGKHIDFDTPYGASLLENTDTAVHALRRDHVLFPASVVSEEKA